MAEETTASPATKTKKTVSALEAFLKRSGYSASEVDAYNERNRVFASTNGGKYHMNKRGEIRILHGPTYPNWEPEA